MKIAVAPISKNLFANTRAAASPSQSSAAARREWRARWILVALCVLAYLPNIVAALFGALPFSDDTAALFGPWREYSRQALAAGVLPLWNARSFCGLPFLPNVQTSILYFFNVVYWVLPLKLAFLLDAVGHNVLLVMGAFTLARALGQSRGAAFLAACALGFSGAVAAHANAGHTTWHAARAYIPWEMWSLLLALRQRETRAALPYVAALTLCFALQFYAGYPPLVLLGGGLCCGLFIAYAASTRRWNWRWPLFAALVGGGVFLLSAAALLPMREVSKLSGHGAGLEYHVAVLGSGTWRSVWRLLSPDFFGGNATLQWSIDIGAWEEAAYGGILVFVLAVGAPFFARDANGKLPRAVPWLWALLPFSLLLALGENTPFYKFAFDTIPLLRMTRVPVRWLEVWALCAALLAGFSFDALWRRVPKSARESSPGGDGKVRNSHTEAASKAPLKDDSLAEKIAVQRVENASASDARVLALRLLVFRAALGIVIALMLGAALLAAAHPAESETWMALVPSFLHDQRLARWSEEAGALRQRALIEAMLTGVIAALLCLYAGRARARHILLGIAVADLMLVFWKSAEPLPQNYLEKSVRWPIAITRRANADQRWASNAFSAPNGNLLNGPDTVDGYDALNGAVHTNFISALEGRKLWMAVYGPSRPNPLLRITGVTHLLAQREQPTMQWKGRTVLQLQSYIGDWRLYQYKWKAWPREYFASRVLAAPRQEQLSLLQSLCEVPGTESLPVVAAPGVFANASPGAQKSGARVLAVTRDWNRSTVKIESAAPAILVQADTLYPGWRAFVDGKSAKMAAANYLFRGVEVPAKSSRVDFVYNSQTLRIGFFLSLCGLSIAVILLCNARRLVIPLPK